MKTPALIGVILLATLAACGGSDHDDGAQAPPGSPPVAGGAPDVFAAQVASVAATAPDDTEPAALDGSAPTMPDDTEPAPIGP